jgi:hypothetical protein
MALKRLCFDTESNYYKDPRSGTGDIEAHKALMLDTVTRTPLRFDCAVVFDEETGQHHEFGGSQAADAVALLATADELISHSGLRHDLLILEHLCGVDALAVIWTIPHHDLFDLHNWSSLKNLALQYIPQRYAALGRAWSERHASADKLYPPTPWGQGQWRSDENFLITRLAKARFDVDCTYAVFTSSAAMDAIRRRSNSTRHGSR